MTWLIDTAQRLARLGQPRSGRDPDREGAESPLSVNEGSVDAMMQRRARQTTGENMDTTTLLVIVLVVLLIGGGGFFYRRRV